MYFTSTVPTQAPAAIRERVQLESADPETGKPADELADGIDVQGSRWLLVRRAVVKQGMWAWQRWRPVVLWQRSAARVTADQALAQARENQAQADRTERSQLRAIAPKLQAGTASSQEVQRVLFFLLREALRPD